jgi:hypothetical protein
MPRPGMKFNRGRVFLIECVSPIDVLDGTNEIASLSRICEQIGHKTASYHVKTISEFETVCKFIGSMGEYPDVEDNKTLFIHLSMHGSGSGLCFGYETLSWKNLVKYVQPIYKMDYPGAKIFSISSCHAASQKLSAEIEKDYDKSENFIPPKYIFIPCEDEIAWDDAIVGWTILLHQLPGVQVDDKRQVQKLLNSIYELGVGKFRYYRWDDEKEKYRKHEPDTED